VKKVRAKRGRSLRSTYLEKTSEKRKQRNGVEERRRENVLLRRHLNSHNRHNQEKKEKTEKGRERRADLYRRGYEIQQRSQGLYSF